MKILRDLSERETEFAKWLDSTGYTLKTKIDLYNHLDTIFLAVCEWQRRDPFLNARLHEHENKLVYVEHCSLSDPQSEVILRSNLKFLKFSHKLSSNKEETQIWQELLRAEIAIGMKKYEDLLWRLKLIQLESEKDPEQEQTNNYILLFTANHCFVEGRGIIKKLFELFEIFELAYLSSSRQDVRKGDVFKITPSLQTLLDEKFEKKGKLDLQKNLIDFSLDEVVDKLPETKFDQINDLENKDYSLLDHAGSVYLTFQDLFKLAKQTNTIYKSLLLLFL